MAMQPDTTQAAAPDATQDDSSAPLAVICIAAMPDGTFQVYTEGDADAQSPDASSQAPEGEEAGETGPQTAQSIDDALNIAGQMLQEEASEGSGDEGDANAPVKDPQAVWNQMAKKSDKARGL